jgi:hypothetical protein
MLLEDSQLEPYVAQGAKVANLRGVRLPEAPKLSNVKNRIIELPASYTNLPSDQEGLSSMMRQEFGVEETPVTEEHKRNAKMLNLQWLKPHIDPNYIFSHNPRCCGIFALGLVVNAEETGLTLANYHTVATLVAHLYAEATRSGLLQSTWSEMDLMIDMHLDEMFAGKLPTTATEGYIKYTKHMGLSTTQHQNRYERGLPYKEPHYSRTQTSDAIRAYPGHSEDLHQSVVRLESLVQQHVALKSNATKTKRRNARRRKATPLQFLTQLQEFLPAEIKRAQFDYIGMTKTCYALMSQFHSDIKNQLGVDHPLMDLDSIQALYPTMVMKILEQTKRV